MSTEQPTLNFRPQQVWGEILWAWWRGLADDTGGRAALRRAPDITAVVLQPAFQRLHRRLLGAGWPDRPWHNDRLAVVAGLLVHVREHSGQTLPVAASQGDKPVLSPLRFQRLLDRTDVHALATDVANWGDAVRKRWAYAYAWPAKAHA